MKGTEAEEELHTTEKSNQKISMNIVTEETQISRIKRVVKTIIIGEKSEGDILNTQLKGKTLEVYWFLLENGAASIREIQKTLVFSSPGVAYYQIKKLMEKGIVTQNDSDEYVVAGNYKFGVLNFFIKIGDMIIPRFSIYLVVFLLGYLAIILSFMIHGDTLFSSPTTGLLLFFLVFGTLAFMYESIKIWALKPRTNKRNEDNE